MVICSGISILVSQAVGRGDRDQLQKLVRTSVWLLFAASLPLTVIGLLLGPWMLRLMQVPADAMPGAVLYLRITMLGILGNMGYNFNAGLLRGLGNSSSSLQLLFISLSLIHTDAADDLLCVDLGGRRIIKKKKKKKTQKKQKKNKKKQKKKKKRQRTLKR